MKLGCWLLLWGVAACQSAPQTDFLYPQRTEADVNYLCAFLYSDFEANDRGLIKQARPQLLVVSSDEVTVYFSNQMTHSTDLPDSVNLPPGNYPCR